MWSIQANKGNDPKVTVAQIRALVLINSSKIWAFVNPKYLGGPRFLVAILVTDLLEKYCELMWRHKNDFSVKEFLQIARYQKSRRLTCYSDPAIH